MENFVLGLFYFLTFYAFLPGVVSRAFGFHVFKRGKHVEKRLALTFDDGPDPVYTAKLLDLLKKYKVTATFFVVGVHAEKHPELLKRMHEEGHEIGVHNYEHKSNWLMKPGTLKKHIRKTCQIIYEATGQRVRYYRPPWGLVNLFDFAAMGDLKIVLWTGMFGDWRKKLGAEALYQRMKKRLSGGEVFLLHDCGRTWGADVDAPANMLVALERFIQTAYAEEAMQFVSISEMMRLNEEQKQIRHGGKQRVSMGKRIVLKLWMVWERIYHAIFRLRRVEENSIFYYRLKKYRGDAIELQNGVQVRREDTVFELHFDNAKMFQIMERSRSMVQVAIRLIREVEHTLPAIARLLRDESMKQVRGLYGISLINRGADKLGFVTVALPSGLFAKMTTVYLKFLMGVLHPTGQERTKDRTRLEPRMIVMSTQELFARYGGAEETGAPRADKQGPRDHSGGSGAATSAAAAEHTAPGADMDLFVTKEAQ